MLQSFRLLRAYYLATPVFWIADEWFGTSVRVAALDGHPEWKSAYYLLCLLCAATLLLRARWLNVLSLFESSANLLLLILGIIMPQYQLIEAVAEGRAVENPITTGLVTNFIIASGIWLIAFYRQLGRIFPKRSFG